MISAVILPGADGTISEATLDSVAFAAEVLVPTPEALAAARARLGPRVRLGGVSEATCDSVLLIKSGEVAPAGFADDLEALAGTLYATAEIRVEGGPPARRLARRGVPFDGEAFAPVEPVCPSLALPPISLAEVPS
jgi:hypothetical protein